MRRLPGRRSGGGGDISGLPKASYITGSPSKMTAGFCDEQHGGSKGSDQCMIVENLMLQITSDEIGDDQLLFGRAASALDSVDACNWLSLSTRIYGLKISDPETARGVLKNVNSIVEALNKHFESRSPRTNSVPAC